MRVKDELGRFGEQLAARHLETSGLTIIDRNWRCRRGELDLVAREGNALVFAEVKTRSSLFFGSPVEAISTAKANRIRTLATLWITERRTSGVGLAPFAEVRFDVVSVLRPRHGGAVEVDHLRGAF